MTMCELMQKLADKEVLEDRIATALWLLNQGFDVEKVAEGARLSREEVEELAKRIA